MAAPFPCPTSKYHSTTYEALSPKRLELSAKEKTVIITGGGTGIGAETAVYFAEAGASQIALLGRREQPLVDTKTSIEQRFPHAHVYIAPTDVTNAQQVDAAFKNFLGESKLDVLVHGAAAPGPHEGVRDVDSDAFLDGISQNLKGSLHVAQAFLRHASPNAVAIEINSAACYTGLGGKFASYCVAKLAVFRLWDLVATENPNLSVFHVQPGIVNTAMSREAGSIEVLGFEDHISLPASFNVWLASPEALFLKGKYVWANWDVNELKQRAQEIEQGSFLSIGHVGWPFGEGNWELEKEF